MSDEKKSSTQLTDAEVVCEFMEARPSKLSENVYLAFSRLGYWMHSPVKRRYTPVGSMTNSLDALHLVEAKLTDAQRLEYWLELSSGGKPETGYWRILHATAEQKLKALAAVIRATSTEPKGDL